MRPGDENECARLLMSMYGTRDAAMNWSREDTETLLTAGFVQGKASPCLFFHKAKKVSIMVHGDEFVAVGCEKHLAETRQIFEEKYMLKVELLCGGETDAKSLTILNKVVTYTDSGILLEADPRHSEIVVRELGLQTAKPSKVPGAKHTHQEKTAERENALGEMDVKCCTEL